MKKMTKLLLLITFTFSIHAHEGHNATPGSYKTLYGGTISVGKEINIEVIVNGLEFTVFPLSHDSKDITDVQVEAQAKPKKEKSYPITLNKLKKGYSAKVDLKGDNRLPVIITTTYKNKKDTFTIQIEE